MPTDVDLNDLRTVRELAAYQRKVQSHLTSLNAEFAGLPFTAEAREQFADLKETDDEISNRIKEIEARQRILSHYAERSEHLEHGDGAGASAVDRTRSTVGAWRSAEHPDPRRRADFSAGLRAIDRCSSMAGFSNSAAARVEKM